MVVEVKLKDGVTDAFIPVRGGAEVSQAEDEVSVQLRCKLSCLLHNRDFPDDLWIMYVDGQPVATDDATTAWIKAATPTLEQMQAAEADKPS